MNGALSNVWADEVGSQWTSLPAVGSERICLISQELNTGTLGHTGYYAVMNHVITGDDPVEFNNMTLRPLPVPAVTSAVLAQLIGLQHRGFR